MDDLVKFSTTKEYRTNRSLQLYHRLVLAALEEMKNENKKDLFRLELKLGDLHIEDVEDSVEYCEEEEEDPALAEATSGTCLASLVFNQADRRRLNLEEEEKIQELKVASDLADRRRLNLEEEKKEKAREAEQLSLRLSELDEKFKKIDDDESLLEQTIVDEGGNSDNETTCTDDCRKLVEERFELGIIGKWTVDENCCKDCIKVQAKSYTKQKKERKKEALTKVKEVNSLQKDILTMEQESLRERISQLNGVKEKSAKVRFGVDPKKNENLREALKKRIEEGKGDTSPFQINMFL
jgi:hypothetical protein